MLNLHQKHSHEISWVAQPSWVSSVNLGWLSHLASHLASIWVIPILLGALRSSWSYTLFNHLGTTCSNLNGTLPLPNWQGINSPQPFCPPQIIQHKHNTIIVPGQETQTQTDVLHPFTNPLATRITKSQLETLLFKANRLRMFQMQVISTLLHCGVWPNLSFFLSFNNDNKSTRVYIHMFNEPFVAIY